MPGRWWPARSERSEPDQTIFVGVGPGPLDKVGVGSIRYLYLADGPAIWSEVAKELSASYGLSPTAWFGHPGHRGFVDREYPGISFLDERLLDAGDFPRAHGVVLPPRVRESAAFRGALIAALDSLQRNEVHRTIPHLARRAYLSSLAEHLWARIDGDAITHLVAAQAPHSPSGLLLAGIADSVGIPMLHFQHSTVGPFALPRIGADYELLNMDALVTSDRIRRPALDVVERWVEEFVARASEKEIPEFDAKYYAADSGNDGFLGLLRQLRYTERSLRQTDSVSRVSISPPVYGLVTRVAATVRSVRSRRRRSAELRRAHAAVATSQQLPDQFWLMMLHYEPEKSTNPDGGSNRDQLEFIRAVARELPAGGHLVAREHPAQFTMSKPGYAGKDPSFYEELAAIPGVLVANRAVTNWELIDRTTLAFTITGTLGLEALVKGIPVVHAGLPWYRGFPGTYHASDLSEIGRLIDTATRFVPEGSLLRDLSLFTQERSVNAVITPGAIRFYESSDWSGDQDFASVAAVIAGFLSG